MYANIWQWNNWFSVADQNIINRSLFPSNVRLHRKESGQPKPMPFRWQMDRKTVDLSRVGETGVGCHTGWLSHCQYRIRWMAVPCGDLHVTCA